jgi:hypothetical protein
LEQVEFGLFWDCPSRLIWYQTGIDVATGDLMVRTTLALESASNWTQNHQEFEMRAAVPGSQLLAIRS